MGYTHYWYYNRPFTNDEWKNISVGFYRLLKALPGVPLANADGIGKPVVNEEYLGFNGASPHAGEPFRLFRTREAWAKHLSLTNGRKWWGFCKTEHQPYDLAVMSVLLLASEIAPGALDVESDEDMQGPVWKRARDVLKHLS